MITFKSILHYFRPYWAIALASIAASSLFELLDLAVPYGIGQILNVLSGEPIDPGLSHLMGWIQAWIAPVAQLSSQSLTLSVLLGLVFLITVAKAPIQPWLTTWFHWDIALRARRNQVGQAIAKILTLPLDFYDENNPGRVAGWVSRGLSNHTWTYPDIAGQFVPKLVRVFGIFTIIALINWPIALLFFVSFSGILGLGFQQLGRIMQREKSLEHYIENTESRTSELITNIKTVKAFATETAELARQQRRLQREFTKAAYRIHKSYVTLLMQQRIVLHLSQFLVLGLTLWATLRGQMSLGHFITTLTIASLAYAELDPLNTMVEMVARRYASMLRFHEFMQLPTGLDAANLVEYPEAVKTYQLTGKVEFRQVSFGYEPDPLFGYGTDEQRQPQAVTDRPILDQINLVIQPCQTVALVGRSGAGKSTLVKLLFRYFDPQQGQVLVDGQDIRALDITGYRKRLAIVHQEVDVFNGTLLENLTYGHPNATSEEIQTACQIARVNEFVKDLPQGYATIVGERGVRLSGGQRQRLGIARALLVNPDILIFDEATSSLDSESERSIQLAMRSVLGTRTTLIIAHRLSTIREADQIVVLDKGRIVEIGNHDELCNRGGLYQRLHSLQSTVDAFRTKDIEIVPNLQTIARLSQ